MAFKGEVVFGVDRVDVLNGHTALDGTKSIASGLGGFLVGENLDAAMLKRTQKVYSILQPAGKWLINGIVSTYA